ncbi:GtrA family protein [Lichenibacterium minor]|uniref:GtrA family protein n=1 Tax=Lichenibacterium minor TaxID=2316528 RepID=A0A4Q2TXM1_9HYPH|nr:GtrA family protein [Lichenibacterium minor]RYC28823.1 GtrA family protein [Lichenibacterium minor]
MRAFARGPLPPAKRVNLAQFARFAAVGGVGFCVDAGVLLVLVRVFRTDPIPSRLLSSAVAVVATYALNRVWAFRAQVGFLRGLGLYIAVQGLGFVCNLSIYSALYLLVPPPWNAPLACLAVASAFALVINYLGAKLIVFRATDRPRGTGVLPN